MTSFITLVRREWYRFMRLFRQTILSPVMSTLLFILVFGLSLGGVINEIKGFKYIDFILPGLIQMSIIQSAYGNSSTSLFMGKMDRSIENFLVSPLNHLEIIFGFISGAIMRSFAVGIASLAAASFLIPIHLNHIFILAASWTLSAIIFGSLGLIVALLSRSWDQVVVFGQFVILPLVYLGGVFYAIDLLPGFWRSLSFFNPVFYSIDLTRFALIGWSETPWTQSIGILFLIACIFVSITFILFRRPQNLLR